MRQPHSLATVPSKPLSAEPAGSDWEHARIRDGAYAATMAGDAAGTLDGLEADILAAIDAISQNGGHSSFPLRATGAGLVGVSPDMQELAAAGREAASQSLGLATAAEELAAASGDVTRVVNEAGRKVRDALACAKGASGLVYDLARLAEEMVGVVDTISSVARQANLLALHATIEAARAGEAGREFSAVAGDVKSLSVETGKAARDVRDRIARLRDTAGSSIRSVESLMAMIQEAQPALAGAAAAVHEHNGSLTQLAHRATDVSLQLGGVSGKAREICASAGAVVRPA